MQLCNSMHNQPKCAYNAGQGGGLQFFSKDAKILPISWLFYIKKQNIQSVWLVLADIRFISTYEGGLSLTQSCHRLLCKDGLRKADAGSKHPIMLWGINLTEENFDRALQHPSTSWWRWRHSDDHTSSLSLCEQIWSWQCVLQWIFPKCFSDFFFFSHNPQHKQQTQHSWPRWQEPVLCGAALEVRGWHHDMRKQLRTVGDWNCFTRRFTVLLPGFSWVLSLSFSLCRSLQRAAGETVNLDEGEEQVSRCSSTSPGYFGVRFSTSEQDT